MAVLCVNYDLYKEPSRAYEDLFGALRSFDGWFHTMKSTWFIWTDWSPQQVYNYLRPHLHARDIVCITPLPHDQGWWTQGFSERALEWLNYHLEIQASQVA
jgi:hypothetical protein